MLTKKEGYVRSINGICCVEFNQSLKVKYFMAVQIVFAVKQNVARSCELLIFFFRNVTAAP